MLLVDTSVWIDHIRVGDAALVVYLEANEVLTHPFVIGELALERLSQPDQVIGALQELPTSVAASDTETRHFIERSALAGSGIGYVDAHLLAATRLTDGAQLWTRDKLLHAVAERLGLGM